LVVRVPVGVGHSFFFQKIAEKQTPEVEEEA